MSHAPAILQSANGEPMTLEGVAARGVVRGLLFELTVEQRYRNPGKKNVEAVYTFPLPFEAVLLDLDVEIGGRRLAGVVVERKEAEGRYEDAIDKGDSAIMLERAGDGLCTLNLGNLMAGECATIRYRYAQLLRLEHGSVRIAVPTVIAPRYGDPAAAGVEPHQVPVTTLAAEYPFSLTLDLAGDIAAGKLASPSHAIATAPTDDGVRVTLAKGAFLDRDFVLNVGAIHGRSLAVVARDGEGYVALASFCADLPRDADELPLKVKLLVDCSGSMAGESIESARRALHRILAGLVPADRFAFSRFGSTVVHEAGGLVPGTTAEVRDASGRVGAMQADLGGTEMPAALRSVFAVGGANAAADVLLITDGEIWDAEGLVAEARAAKQRVFVVGIGSAPAEGVLKRLAEASGGACEFVAPNEDAEGAILRMFARLRAPRVERADIRWPLTPAWTTPLPGGLFGGETIHAFAGFAATPGGEAKLKLVPHGDGAPLEAAATLPATVVEARTLARVAAARRIETASEAEQLQLALAYGLLTSRTNLLVVHERAEGEKAKDLPELAQVAQMHAAGWHGVGSLVCEHPSMESTCRFMSPSTGIEFDKLDVAESVSYRSLSFELPAPRSTDFAHFFAYLAYLHSGRLPNSIRDLERSGLPAAVLDDLRNLIVGGNTEADVVRAFLDAVGILLAHGTIDVKVTRQLVRALRHQFAAPSECAGLREYVHALLQTVMSGAAA